MILVNGVANERVVAADRGLAYGDGVFRTLLTRRGAPFAWQRHYRKLARDCGALSIPCPDQAVLSKEVAAATNGLIEAVVKIIVTRGAGERGYAPPSSPSVTRIVMASPPPDHPESFARAGVRVHWCELRLPDQPRLAGIKHLNRLENVLARAEWADPEVAEGLIRDARGNLVGGTMSNLFIVEGDRLLTPGLTQCGVAGVTRERIIESAARQGVGCREEAVSPERLLEADEALLVNSVIGVWPIRACRDRVWTPGAYAARVRKWLDADEA